LDAIDADDMEPSPLMTDGILIYYFFKGGPEPPPPFKAMGFGGSEYDPTPDQLKMLKIFRQAYNMLAFRFMV